MAATKWTKSAWSSIVKKYPKLEGKSEGVAFCAWGIENGIDVLPGIRALAKQTGTKLKFSGASIGGARVAMVRAKKKASSTRSPAAKRRGRPAKKRGLGTDVGEVIATLLEDLGAEIEDASREYESGKARLSAAKANFKKLRPVFQQYHAARSRKLAKLLDSTR